MKPRLSFKDFDVSRYAWQTGRVGKLEACLSGMAEFQKERTVSAMRIQTYQSSFEVS